MAAGWSEYQEEVAEFYRKIGLDAQTNVTVQGVRTKHDVDVLVKSHHAGFDITWIVECKHWNSSVSKLHVLALREIVSDIGADRGILLAEKGYQSGAFEAASLTNVHLTSLTDTRRTASAEIFAMRLREAYDRVEICREQYWSIPKVRRIECGLRPEFMEDGYSGARVIGLVAELFPKAFRGVYPIELDILQRSSVSGAPEKFDSAEDVCKFIEQKMNELETKLKACVDIND